MAQKINPTALRLEKTNRHHRGCWYSDYYYSHQLQNNYRVCNYVESIFNNIKRCEPSFFVKVGHQCNQIFCSFPKRRRRTKRFGQRIHRGNVTSQRLSAKASTFLHTKFPQKSSRQRANKVLHNPLSTGSLFYGFLLRKKTMEQSLQPRDWRLESTSQKLISAPLVAKPMVDLTSTADSKKAVLSGDAHGDTSTYPYGVRCKNLFGDSLLQALVYRGINCIHSTTQLSPSTIGVQKKSAHKKRIERVINSAYFAVAQKKWYAQKKFNLGSATIPPFEGGEKSGLYPIKVPFVQQCSEFLAQKVCRALAQRMAFARLRRQILWDVKVSRYIKGVRVSCSGRVESKSKKAQKARTRTFQWGQTELHVFSSLVQFTSKDLITPFGKIGVKVWVCYGFN